MMDVKFVGSPQAKTFANNEKYLNSNESKKSPDKIYGVPNVNDITKCTQTESHYDKKETPN